MKIKRLLLLVTAAALTAAAVTSCFPEDGKEDLNPETPETGGEGQTGGEGDSGNMSSDLIRRIDIIESDPSNSATTLTFEYDGTGNISRITEACSYGGDGIDDTFEYIFDRTVTGLDISGIDGGVEYPIMTIYDDNGDGVAEKIGISEEYGDTEYIGLEYDSSWHLVKVDADDPYVSREFFWTDGNLTGSTGGTDYSYTYSEYGNNANIDLNWILTGGYHNDAFMIGGLSGLLGARSLNYADYVPLFDMNSESAAREPIAADGEYTYTSKSQRIAHDEASTEFDLSGERLTGITGIVPVYTVSTEYTVYRTITDYDRYTEGPDGTRLYYEYSQTVTSTKETDRKLAYRYTIEFTISYID